MKSVNIMWIKWNPSPAGKRVGDCSVRAISKALNLDWDTTYLMICDMGFQMKDMPSSDSVWGAVLKEEGFSRYSVSNRCPNCYTIKDFCVDHPNGIYVVGVGGHVVTIIDGNYFDSWDSGDEIPIYYWVK